MSVTRLDRIDVPQWATEKFIKTPEGYLKGTASITNIGVFLYQKADGTVEAELRHPDDVFASESLDSYRMKPLTNDHPTEKVTAENIKQYQVGNLGELPGEVQGIYLVMDMIIQDAQAVMDVLGGKVELSVGYECDVVDESGTWLGVPYTKRQKNIRANHVAIVDRARAGETAKIRLDSADAIMVSDAVPRTAEKDTCGGKPMADLKKIKLDGGIMEYEVDAQVAIALDSAIKKADSVQVSLDTMTQEKSKVEAERDTLKDKADSLEKELAAAKAEKLDSAKIDEAVARRVAILGVAKDAEVEVKADMSEQDIQKAIILSQFPDAKLDGKDAVYLDARYDGAVEFIAKKGDAENRQVQGEHLESHDDGIPVVDAAKSRQAMLDRLMKKGK